MQQNMNQKPLTRDEWLALLETRHPKAIDMGLDRVSQVKNNLGLHFDCPVITVGGTNGKGSTCAMLESIYLHAGYHVGMYTSPHLIDFNERARVNGEFVSNDALVAAFEQVEAARKEISLTYFEFTTLAIMKVFADAKLDIVILEVGLGGRLDAVNILDADVAIVTSVDLDHMEYLGDTREKIGFEKAGIFRKDKTAICGDPLPPQTLVDHANQIGADLWLVGRDFNFQGDKQQWAYGGRAQRRNALAYPGLRGANQLLNASAALAAVEALKDKLPVGAQEVRSGLATVELPGRFQVIPGKPVIILDVAHNPHAAAVLDNNLDNMGYFPYTYAVFGAMKDKDIDGVIAKVRHHIDHWCVTDLPTPRAASAAQIKEKLDAAGINSQQDDHSVVEFHTPADALKNALSRASENDRIVVFGSFVTVAGVIAARKAGLH